MTLLKIVESDTTKELETHVNTWVKESGVVHVVVNMRVYPPSFEDGRKQWACYIIYKEKYAEGERS